MLYPLWGVFFFFNYQEKIREQDYFYPKHYKSSLQTNLSLSSVTDFEDISVSPRWCNTSVISPPSR